MSVQQCDLFQAFAFFGLPQKNVTTKSKSGEMPLTGGRGVLPGQLVLVISFDLRIHERTKSTRQVKGLKCANLFAKFQI